LANLLFKGKGVVADQKQACSLWRKAANAGETTAAQNMQNQCTLQSASK
jgi:TPR repeat protein